MASGEGPTGSHKVHGTLRLEPPGRLGKLQLLRANAGLTELRLDFGTGHIGYRVRLRCAMRAGARSAWCVVSLLVFAWAGVGGSTVLPHVVGAPL